VLGAVALGFEEVLVDERVLVQVFVGGSSLEPLLKLC
jgi:hypothetical protein